MGNKKISELNLLTNPQLSTIIPVVEGGETQKLAVGSILNSVLPISASSIVASSIIVNGTITANNIVSQSIEYYTGSTNHGSELINNHTYTGSVLITGSATIKGDVTISGSLFISGTTEFGGDLVPREARGATLGTLERPFREIYLQSGSINIESDIPGDPNTTLSNVGGNILVSAGGMRLIGDASFIAATGSFSFISGSMTQVGDYAQTGDYTLTGDKTITGSLQISGSGFIHTHRILTDLDTGSFLTSLNGAISSSAQITSFGFVSGSYETTGRGILSGSISYTSLTNIPSGIVSSSSQLTSSLDLRYATTGSNTFIGDQTITGSLYVSSSLKITNGFYVDGHKQFNYAAFSDLTIQSASANIAYPMKLNTTELAEGFSVVSGSRITAVNGGTYNLQFSAQLEQTSNNAAEISIWLRKNGTNIPNSNTELTIEKIGGGGKLVAAWNYVVQLNATQYVELMWSSTRSDTLLHYHATQSTPTRPATPSVIVTMTQIA